MSAVDRLLNLAACLLETDQPISAEELNATVPGYGQSKFETFRRMFERDKAALEDMGLDIRYHDLGDGVAGYTATWSSPTTRADLSQRELAALHLAVTSVVLDGVDDAEVTSGLRKLGGTIGGGGRPVAEIPIPEVLADLFDAVLHHRVVSFEYAAASSASTATREIEPARLQFEGGHWYVSGHDRARNDARSFRVERIRGTVTLGPAEGFVPPERPRGVNVRPWELGDESPATARLRLDRAVAPSFLALAGDVVAEASSTPGSIEVDLTVTHRPGLFNVVLDLLGGAEILSPDDLRQQFVAHLEALAGVD